MVEGVGGLEVAPVVVGMAGDRVHISVSGAVEALDVSSAAAT